LRLLFNIRDDDVDNTESEASELCAEMEVSMMLRKIDPVVDVKPVLGLTCGATNVLDPFCHPSEALVKMHSFQRCFELNYPCVVYPGSCDQCAHWMISSVCDSI
jgi:hypothetical protein